MTSLKWINGQIEIFNRKIKILNNKLNHKHMEITDPLESELTIEEIQTVLSHVTQTLQTLQQIKAELEGWEVVKNFIQDIGKTYVLEIDDWYCKNEYQTIKKALEVKDEI